MKYANEIIKYGKIKPFFDRDYSFNTIDIETVDNDLFLFGCTVNRKHYTEYNDFYDHLHNLLITCIQTKRDLLTWSRYDNTHLMKLILQNASKQDINKILLRVGKISPIYEYEYNGFTIQIVNIIKDSILFKFIDLNGTKRNVTIYNLKNLYDTDLLNTAKNYSLDYYSKMGVEYHIIDKKRFDSDIDYKNGVIESNRLDNIVLLDIADKMLETFRLISGVTPKSIYTNGSLARNYLLSQKGVFNSNKLNFNNLFNKGKMKDRLLDYSMRSYHGGKIESYILGYVPKAKVIDITSAYPYAMSLLPELTKKIIHSSSERLLQNYFYAFIRCEIFINNRDLIHPIIVENPINKSNVSPYGYMETVITKIEYDYLKKHNVYVKMIDFYAVEHTNNYPYKDIVDTLFNARIDTKISNPSLSQMYKIILNSLYGITYELTDVYTEIDDNIKWIGYRAGDYFNPIIASYITAYTRTYLSEVSNDIRENGGTILLNMTDSIIYTGSSRLNVFSDTKILGKFEKPEEIKNVMILGSGRYEYQNEFNNKFTIKNRGFSVSVKDKSFYSMLNLSDNISLPHRTFVTSFKASTKKYAYEKMGYLIDDTYNINPFNLGGKRLIKNYNVNLNTEYTLTYPVYLEKGIVKYEMAKN